MGVPSPKAPPTPTTTATPKGFPSGDSVEIKPAKVYTAAPSSAQVDAGTARLRTGQQGPAVADIQNKLGLPADGKFGKNTEVAVAVFQKKEGLPTTGVVDDKTKKALDAKSAGGGTTSAPPPTGGTSGSSGTGAVSGTTPPPPPLASMTSAQKLDFASGLLESGKLKPGMSPAADKEIETMIKFADSPTPLTTGPGSETIELVAAKQRFSKAAKAAGYSVP